MGVTLLKQGPPAGGGGGNCIPHHLRCPFTQNFTSALISAFCLAEKRKERVHVIAMTGSALQVCYSHITLPALVSSYGT
jgi:hypothetical protein